MVFKDLLFALILGFILSTIFTAIIRRRGPRTGFFWFFVIVFLATWAGGIWFPPIGPSIRGIYWFPSLMVGLIAAFLLTVLAERRTPKNRQETLEALARMEEKREMEQATYIALSMLFWFVLALLIAAIIIRYLIK
jgi:hypothetical protein